MYMLWNEGTSFDIDYEFRNMFVRVSRHFRYQQMQIQA